MIAISPAAAVGSSISKRRRSLGLSQEELAHRAACAKNHLSDIERGKKWPSGALVQRIAEALGCEASSLLEALVERLWAVPPTVDIAAHWLPMPEHWINAAPPPRAMADKIAEALDYVEERSTFADLKDGRYGWVLNTTENVSTLDHVCPDHEGGAGYYIGLGKPDDHFDMRTPADVLRWLSHMSTKSWCVDNCYGGLTQALGRIVNFMELSQRAAAADSAAALLHGLGRECERYGSRVRLVIHPPKPELDHDGFIVQANFGGWQKGETVRRKQDSLRGALSAIVSEVAGWEWLSAEAISERNAKRDEAMREKMAAYHERRRQESEARDRESRERARAEAAKREARRLQCTRCGKRVLRRESDSLLSHHRLPSGEWCPGGFQPKSKPPGFVKKQDRKPRCPECGKRSTQLSDGTWRSHKRIDTADRQWCPGGRPPPEGVD